MLFAPSGFVFELISAVLQLPPTCEARNGLIDSHLSNIVEKLRYGQKDSCFVLEEALGIRGKEFTVACALGGGVAPLIKLRSV